MKYEPWFVGSHRTVDRLIDDKRIAICEVYSGAADNNEHADQIQRLIAAAPKLLIEMKLLVATIYIIEADREKAKIDTLVARQLIEEIEAEVGK